MVAKKAQWLGSCSYHTQFLSVITKRKNFSFFRQHVFNNIKKEVILFIYLFALASEGERQAKASLFQIKTSFLSGSVQKSQEILRLCPTSFGFSVGRGCGKSAHLARNASLTSYVLKNALLSSLVPREPEIILWLVCYLFLARESTLSWNEISHPEGSPKT